MKVAVPCSSILLILASLQAAMGVEPKDYFTDVKGNLTKIAWAHAVNSQEKLHNALNNTAVMMLEADVSMGTLAGNDTAKLPIMAHPPNTTSDLSLKDFLDQVIKKNGTKGIKLDFKSAEAATESKPILESFKNDLKFPVFLNADILDGPLNATATVDANAFLDMAVAFPNYTLSVGWATNGDLKNNTTGQYTEEQVQKMISTLTSKNVSQPVTYPVRAAFAAGNATAMKSLLDKSANLTKATLSIWSSEGDAVDEKKLSQLVKDVGVEKVYVDVPEDLMKKLSFSGASSISVPSPMIAASLIVTALLSMFADRI